MASDTSYNIEKKPKMASIEAARGIAALCVVFMHAANLMNVEHFSRHVGMGRIFDFGYVGVDFFFVLSGFIITYIHFHEIGRINTIPRYLWRRFSRIYPIFWIILILAIAATSLARFSTGRPIDFGIGLSDIFSTVLLLMTSDGEPKYIGPAWTLRYEVLFYLAFCILLANTRIGTLLFATWAAIVVGNALGIIHLLLPFNLSNAHCFEFLIGVLVGVAARRYTLHTSRKILLVSLLLFIAATAFEVYGPLPRHSPEGRLVLGLASALILSALVGLERLQSICTPNWMARIGSASYSIYLGHILLISIFYMLLLKAGLYHELPEPILYFGAVAFALAGTFLIGIYVETPLVRSLKEAGIRRP